VVIGHTLYLYSERRTVKARNLAADPRVAVHLESGEEVVILRATAEDLGAPGGEPEVVAALSAKYTSEGDKQYLPDADPDFDVVYAIRPHTAHGIVHLLSSDQADVASAFAVSGSWQVRRPGRLALGPGRPAAA
jgi:hypothetical protein